MNGKFALTEEELRHYKEQGFVGPRTLCAPEMMRAHVERFEKSLFVDGKGLAMRHLEDRSLYDLCCHPALVDPIASILGPDLIIWRCRFIVKEPGGSEIPWHQDAAYHRRHLDPMVNVSVWLALDDVDEENACVRLIPGSHRLEVPHVRSHVEAHQDFPEMADPRHVDARSAVHMRMSKGQFYLFNETITHGSGPNRSQRRRAGLSIRVTTPEVRIKPVRNVIPVLIRGEDRFRRNALASPPR